MEKVVKIKSIGQVTHDVKQFIVERPEGYEFTPGHATEISINQEEWKDEKRPFTFTSLNEEGDELIVRDTWGAIEYKGPGYIIAGGAGITPYISMLRDLKKKDKLAGMNLFFSNKTDKDIILKEELDSMLGENATYVITDQEDTKHTNAYLNEEFLKSNISDLSKQFYVCGPPEMTEEINKTLKNMGADNDAVQLDDQ